MNLKAIPIFNLNKKVSTTLLLAFVLCLFMPKQNVFGQRLLHDKRLKTTSQEKKKTRKKFFKMRNHEDVKTSDVKVRTSAPPQISSDPKTLIKPQNREESQDYDFKEREANRPYRPEISYKGYRKDKRQNRNPNKAEGSFKGHLKSSSLNVKPGRGVSTTKGEKGRSEEAKNQRYKARSKEMQLYAGDMKYSPLTGKKGRGARYYSGKQAKGQSKRSKQKDLRAKSTAISQYSGNIKVTATGKSKKSSYQGDLKMSSLSSKTRYFKKLSKKVNQFEGNIRIRSQKHKDLHPSVAYLQGKKKDSRQKKERLRRRKIFWFRLWRSSDQPNSVKQKPEKPKYDSRESEIWYD